MTEDELKEIKALAGVVKPPLSEVLSELIAEVRRLQTMLNRAKHEGASCVMLAERCNALERERDEARNELFDLRNKAGCGPEQRGPDVWKQLDEARAEVERERDDMKSTANALSHELAEMSQEQARIAEAMSCKPDDADDLVEAVRLLVVERDEARAEIHHTQGLLTASRLEVKRLKADAADHEAEMQGHQELATALNKSLNEARAEVERHSQLKVAVVQALGACVRYRLDPEAPSAVTILKDVEHSLREVERLKAQPKDLDWHLEPDEVER